MLYHHASFKLPLQSPSHPVGARGAADVARSWPLHANRLVSLHDGMGSIVVAEVFEHHRSRPDLADRVGDLLAGAFEQGVSGFGYWVFSLPALLRVSHIWFISCLSHSAAHDRDRACSCRESRTGSRPVLFIT